MQSFNLAELYAQAQAEGASFKPLPEDKYPVKVESAELKTTSTNKPMIKVVLRVQGGEFNNRKLWDQWTLSTDNPTALKIFFEKLAAFGLGDPGYLASVGGDLNQVAQALVGREAVAQVGTREWQGKPRNDVSFYDPPAGPGTPGSGPAPAAPAAPTPPASAPPAPPAPPQPSF